MTTTQFTLAQVPRLTTLPLEGMTQGEAVAMNWTSGSVLLDTQEKRGTKGDGVICMLWVTEKLGGVGGKWL